jgi:hypothetical protein
MHIPQFLKKKPKKILFSYNLIVCDILMINKYIIK